MRNRGASHHTVPVTTEPLTLTILSMKVSAGLADNLISKTLLNLLTLYKFWNKEINDTSVGMSRSSEVGQRWRVVDMLLCVRNYQIRISSNCEKLPVYGTKMWRKFNWLIGYVLCKLRECRTQLFKIASQLLCVKKNAHSTCMCLFLGKRQTAFWPCSIYKLWNLFWKVENSEWCRLVVNLAFSDMNKRVLWDWYFCCLLDKPIDYLWSCSFLFLEKALSPIFYDKNIGEVHWISFLNIWAYLYLSVFSSAWGSKLKAFATTRKKSSSTRKNSQSVAPVVWNVKNAKHNDERRT